MPRQGSTHVGYCGNGHEIHHPRRRHPLRRVYLHSLAQPKENDHGSSDRHGNGGNEDTKARDNPSRNEPEQRRKAKVGSSVKTCDKDCGKQRQVYYSQARGSRPSQPSREWVSPQCSCSCLQPEDDLNKWHDERGCNKLVQTPAHMRRRPTGEHRLRYWCAAQYHQGLQTFRLGNCKYDCLCENATA